MFRLDGKRCLITGGGTGIGSGIADVFAQQGARVALSGRRLDVLEGAVARLEASHGAGCAVAVQGDVSQVEGARSMVAECITKLGGIELLVNSAGSVDRVTSLDSTIEGWDSIFALNVRGTFITCQEAIRWMVEHGGGSIVNISSTASEKAYSPAAS
jgi:NAD(P)-dependent dehydrogenase (short-subunit alcohol dehydrogenase family)